MHNPVLALERVSFSVPVTQNGGFFSTSNGGMYNLLSQVDLTVQKEGRHALLGPSGVGKTTLLRLVTGLLRPTEGTILFEGRDCTDFLPSKRPVAFLFQGAPVLPWQNVRDNLTYPLRARGLIHKREVHTYAKDVAGRSRIPEKLLERFPENLSGGERQRVALGAALSLVWWGGARILLLDEPFTGLDSELREELLKEVIATLKEKGVAMLLVTHDHTEAKAVCDTVTVLSSDKS